MFSNIRTVYVFSLCLIRHTRRNICSHALSNLASRLYGEGRAVALLEVDLVTRSGLNVVQNILSDEDEGDLVSLIMTQYDKKIR